MTEWDRQKKKITQSAREISISQESILGRRRVRVRYLLNMLEPEPQLLWNFMESRAMQLRSREAAGGALAKRD